MAGADRRTVLAGGALALMAGRTLAADNPQSPTTTDAPPPNPLSTVRGRWLEERSLVSTQGLEYRLVISSPSGAAPEAGFPVVYVTDGNAHAPVLGEIARLAEGDVGPVLVVGIGYPTSGLYDGRRSFDLTPPGELAKDADPESSDFRNEKIGGADQFLDFIRDQVKPAVAAGWSVDPARQALFGHSLGGLFVVHALFTRPDDFAGYVAASPAIWFNRRTVLGEEPAFAARAAAHKGLRVLLTAGGNEGRMSPFAEWKLRRLAAADPASFGGGSVDAIVSRIAHANAGTHMKDLARDLAGRLARDGLDAIFVEYPGEEHAASAVDAYNRGIRFVFGPGS